MTPEMPASTDSASDDDSACSRCRDDAVLRVVRTEIDGRVPSGRRSSTDSTTVCRDCFARLRATPDASFNSLFDDATATARSAKHFIKIERL